MLLRFRKHNVAIVADVKKAFLHLELHDTDRDVTRFPWIKDLTKNVQKGNLKIYRFTPVAFGVISSPFLLSATLPRHLRTEGTKFRKEGMKKYATIIQETINDTYVNIFITSASSCKDAINVYRLMKTTFKKASMNSRK